MTGSAALLEVKVTGDKAVLKKLRQITRSVKDPRMANRQVSVWLFRWVNQNFKSQGGKVGGWAPFKIGGRKLPGGGIDRSAKLLQDTGFLRASFKPFYGKTFAGIGAGPHRIKANIPIWHERGIPTRNLPQRRMLPRDTDRDVKQGIIRIYDTYLRRVLK
jgi:phage gpG-like protein